MTHDDLPPAYTEAQREARRIALRYRRDAKGDTEQLILAVMVLRQAAQIIQDGIDKLSGGRLR